MSWFLPASAASLQIPALFGSKLLVFPYTLQAAHLPRSLCFMLFLLLCGILRPAPPHLEPRFFLFILRILSPSWEFPRTWCEQSLAHSREQYIVLEGRTCPPVGWMLQAFVAMGGGGLPHPCIAPFKRWESESQGSSSDSPEWPWPWGPWLTH